MPSFKALFTLCISLSAPSILMDSVQFHVAKYFQFQYKNVMEANQVAGADKESRHLSANPSGLYHSNQNFMYIVAIIFSNKGVNR
jgi:hypothetical protein